MFSSYQEMYYASKSMEFIVRKRLDMVHMAMDAGDYINTYVHTTIPSRGYSPYNKIKETLKVKTFKVQKPKYTHL